MSDKAKNKSTDSPQQPGPLVPVYAGLDIVKGIQAFRRGDIILYTIHGEPEQVRKLIGELENRQVGEVIALISHRASDAAELPSAHNESDDKPEGAC